MDFSNKVIIVTGGGTGIGRSTCIELAKTGIKQVIGNTLILFSKVKIKKILPIILNRLVKPFCKSYWIKDSYFFTINF